MCPIDLYANWPSARRSAETTRKIEEEIAARRAVDAAEQRRLDGRRPTDLSAFDPDHHRKVRDAREKMRRSDAGLVASLLSGLVDAVDGKPLSEVLGFTNQGGQGYGRLIGVGMSNTQLDSFVDAFRAAISALGLAVNPRALPANSANRTALIARGLGVSASNSDKIHPATPRPVRRFDEFSAMFAESPTLAGAIQAGSQDNIPIGVMELVSAMIGALKAAVRANDPSAIRLVGQDFGAMAASLHELAGGATAQRSGYRTARKLDALHPRGAITEIEWPDGKKTKTRLASLYQNRKG